MRFDFQMVQLLFPSVLFTSKTSGIHLTFDDGPHPKATPAILDILNTRNIKATFFFLGQNVQRYPEIAQQVINRGHQVGNHSYSHRNLFFASSKKIHDEVIKTEEILTSALGKRSRYFRPPYGFFNVTMLHILEKLDLSCVLWSVDSKDYRARCQSSITQRVLRQASNGSVLLFHDNNATAGALQSYLPPLLDALLENRFTFNEFSS